jgi:hypothetical protein
MIPAALKLLITAVGLQKCNCLEINNIAPLSFLGMPDVSLSAHSRHIQIGRVFGQDGHDRRDSQATRLRNTRSDAFLTNMGGAE